MTDLSKAHIRKCGCGDSICQQHTLSTQGSVGFDLETATLYANAGPLLDGLTRLLRQIVETSAYDDAKAGEDPGLLADVEFARQAITDATGKECRIFGGADQAAFYAVAAFPGGYHVNETPLGTVYVPLANVAPPPTPHKPRPIGKSKALGMGYGEKGEPK